MTDGNLAVVVRWGWYSIGVNLVVAALHGLIAVASGSIAVTAEFLHNITDLASAAAVVAGLKLAARKSRAFPYGLYKVENLVAVGIAMMIFLTAYEISSSVLTATAEIPRVDGWMLPSLIVTMAIPLAFSFFEMRVARRTNSPALLADAREYRVHAYTTGLAFAALLSAWFELPFDRIAALIIMIAVVKTGWDLLADGLRVLLDASLDATSVGEIKRIIEADPVVSEVNWVTGRNAGRFRFVEAGVTLRLVDLARAEAASRRIEAAVRSALPQIERILLHLEPPTPTRLRYALPLADLSGTISQHFGEAPYFAFVTLDRASGAIHEQNIRTNVHRAEERAKGLRVAEWLAREKVDRVVVPRSLEGRGPAYVFRDSGIELEMTEAQTLADHFARPASSENAVEDHPGGDLTGRRPTGQSQVTECQIPSSRFY
ncbi:MAG: cation diffusion facilitator family transporter [Reyranellaceae bacterium]